MHHGVLPGTRDTLRRNRVWSVLTSPTSVDLDAWKNTFSRYRSSVGFPLDNMTSKPIYLWANASQFSRAQPVFR